MRPLGVALFGASLGAHQGMGQALALWPPDSGGAGQAENLSYLPTQDRWYGLLA